MDIKETAGAGGGAGYSDEQIDGNSGVAGVHAAYNGYNPDDGTYVSKGSLAKRRKIEILPTDTDDELTNRTNAMYNDSQAYALMDSRLRQVMAQDNLQFGEPTRAGMDYYMMSEYGNSRLDDNPDILTSEYAKDNRDQNENPLAPLVQGSARFAVRTISTALTLPLTVANNVAELFGANPDMTDIRRFTDITDDYIDKVKEAIPQYDTQAEEEARSQHPMKYMFTTGGGVAEFIDNLGYTAGSALPILALGRAAPAAAAGLAGLNVATAIKKAVLDQQASDNKWYENLGPLVAAVAAAVVTSKLPKGLQNGIKTLATGAIAATGEAETETAHAVNEYIQEKTDAIDSNISARKAEVIRKYAETAGELLTRMEMALPAEKEQIAQELENLTIDRDNELAMLDWQRTKAVNQAVKDSESTANITRLANYGILTVSNTLQFGKLLTGGFKRYATNVSAKALDEAMEYAGKRYAAAQERAGANLIRKAQTRLDKNRIIQEGLNEYSVKTGSKIFDESKKLKTYEYVAAALRHPLAEGAEEMEQSMASNAGKAYAERNTDDYYGQISGLDAFRRSESAVAAALTAAGKTLGSEQAWSEFLAGAVTGAIGMPGIRSPRFKRMTGERDASGKLTETSHWRSPIYFQGGVYGEIRKAMFDRENRGRMAEELNKRLSPDGRKDWERRMANMAHHMQYDDDKRTIIGLSDGKDKYHWENAEDAELVKTVELFQQTGQMDLLNAFARSELDYETVDELRDLQSRTTTVDKNGDKVGRYTEFDLTDIGENPSDSQKQHLEDEAARMRWKVKTDVNRRLEAISLYAEARRQLQLDAKNGLSAENMNVLAWYATRLGLFDKRTESMFSENESSLERFNSVIGDFFEERRKEIDDKLAETARLIAEIEKDGKGNEESKALRSEAERLRLTKVRLDLAEEEWNDRWSRSRKADTALGMAKILFSGNEESDPIGSIPAKKPWYLPDKVWARRVGAKQSPAADRRAALMGFSLARVGEEGLSAPGVLDAIIDELEKDDVSSTVLRDAFYDAEERKAFAAALHDMRECQAAIVRYKDLYQFYKDNPYAAEARAKETKDKFDTMAAQATIQEVITRLRKCETVKAMYEEVVKMIKEGYDTDLINSAIKSLEKEGNETAKAFLENQDFLQVFCAAVDSVAPVTESGSEVGSKLGHVVLKEVAIEAATESDSVEDMHGYIESRLGQALASAEAFTDFVYEKGIVDAEAMPKEKFLAAMKTGAARFTVNKDGQFVDDLQSADGTAMTQNRMAGLRDVMPRVLEAVDSIIKEKLWKKQTYTFGTHVDWPETNHLAVAMAKLTESDAKLKQAEFQRKLAEIGGGTYDPVSGETVKAVPDSDVRGEQQPSEPLDGETALDNGHEETADEANRERIERQADELQPSAGQETDGRTGGENAKTGREGDEGGGRRPSLWIPAVPFFSTKFKRLGKLVRTKLIAVRNGVDTIVSEAESSFSKFWNTMEKLNVWDFVDGQEKGSKNALRQGENVYFIVDKMDSATGKSQIFGLDADEISYNGVPVVFMCVKRGDKYQCVGTMPTGKAKLERDGQLSAWESIVTAAVQSEGAYVHGVAGRVAGVHQGLVETTDRENTLDKVCGSAENVTLAIKKNADDKNDDGIKVSGEEDIEVEEIDGAEKMKNSVVHVLVKDNATDKYIPMPCRIAHFDKKSEARLGQTQSWKETLDAITKIADTVKGMTDVTAANKALTPEYLKLCNKLALLAHGTHINVIKTKNGKLLLSVSRPRYSDGRAIELKDEKGETMYQKDAKGEYILDKEGNRKPLKERIFSNTPIDGSVDVAAWLRDTLMSDDFNVPFRVVVEEMKKSDYGTRLIEDGIITSNIADGGGAHTRGSYVQVEYGVTEKRDVDPELRRTESKLDKMKMIGKSVLKEEGGRVSLDGRELKGEERALALALINDNVEYETYTGRYGDYVVVRDELEGYTSYSLFKGVITKERSFPPDITLAHVILEVKAWDDIVDAIMKAFGDWGFVKDRDAIYRKFRAVARGEKSPSELDAAILFNSELRGQFLSGWRTLFRLWGDNEAAADCDLIEQFANDEVAKTTFRQAEETRQDAPQEQSREETRPETEETQPAEPAETPSPAEAREPAAAQETAAPSSEAATDETAPVDERAPQLTEEPVAPAPQAVEKKAKTKRESKGGKEKKRSLQKLNNEATQDMSSNTPNGIQEEDTRLSVVKPTESSEPRVDIPREVEALRKVVPWMTRDEAVMIVDRLMEVAGKGPVAQGMFKDGLMVISTKGVRGTVFHEAFHSIFITALDAKTRDALIKDAMRTFGATRVAEAEECLADAFRDFMVGQVYDRSWTRRIRDFFDWLMNLLDIGGERRYVTMNSVFRKISSGAYANAGRGRFNDITLRDLRIAEYRKLGYSEDEIRFFERQRGAFSSRSPEVRNMILEAGYTEESFDLLSQKGRDEVVACL